MTEALDQGGPTSHSFVSQRLRLNYLDWGNPDAPKLLLVHGGQDHAHNWDWVARALRHDWHIIAPDLRGHGDSAWSPDGAYTMPYYVADLAQLIHQLGPEPVSIIGHSLGGNIALRYTGLYPDRVRRIVAIEGLGPSPKMLAERNAIDFREHWRTWIDQRRALSARVPRRYATIEQALERMRAENGHLSAEQARHLTVHGIARNEDGTFSWKFDNYVRSALPLDLSDDQIHAVWNAITCPTLLVYGDDSWASNPERDGRARHFRNAEVISFADAGHWVHHDRFDAFIDAAARFLA